MRQFILGIRQIRGEMDIAPGKELPVLLQHSSKTDRRRAKAYAELLAGVGRVASVTVLAEDAEPPISATALLNDMRLLVPMKGLIDIDAERSRLEKRLERIGADLARARAKLDNENFVNNAPPDVVTKETRRAAELANTIAQLTEQLEKLTKLT